MLRRDYMLKLIEQFSKMVVQLLGLDFVEEPLVFGEDFNELLKAYFKIQPDKLDLLLIEHPERDALLLDEHSKNSQLSLFARAGLVFVQNNDLKKAEICLKIIERIKQRHIGLYEFPNVELQKIDNEINRLASVLNNQD